MLYKSTRELSTKENTALRRTKYRFYYVSEPKASVNSLTV